MAFDKTASHLSSNSPPGPLFSRRASLILADTGSAIFTPDGRYRVEGDIGDALWQRVGLHRFELGKLDPYLPHPAQLPDDWHFPC